MLFFSYLISSVFATHSVNENFVLPAGIEIVYQRINLRVQFFHFGEEVHIWFLPVIDNALIRIPVRRILLRLIVR